MRKSSIDRSMVVSDQSFVVPSKAMPGFNLRIWRTDGVREPPNARDLNMMVHHQFRKTEVTHMRNYQAGKPSTTFDVAVETLPSIPERPAAEAALQAPQPRPHPGTKAREASGGGFLTTDERRSLGRWRQAAVDEGIVERWNQLPPLGQYRRVAGPIPEARDAARPELRHRIGHKDLSGDNGGGDDGRH